ncbi:MAG: T9SS type A sorting domain-containing protein [Ignavibacteria bacterium]|nr:T9SS type A sorting domain-containing protein [Ignavibacteria bacterium]
MKILTTVMLYLMLFSAPYAKSQWVNQFLPISFPVASCYFPSANTGYIVGYGNLISKTSNGGTNWIDMSLPTTAENMNSVWFLNENTGFLCSTRDTLLYTTNGGINWTNHFYTVYQSDRIFFINGQTGWFTSNGLYKTTNAGINWFQISNQRAQSFIFINESTGWKINYTGSGNNELLKTTDGGVSWNVMFTTGNFRNLYSIDFINENTGWVCGYRGYIAKTENGGVNLTVQRDVETDACYIRDFVNPNTGWAAGDNSLVVRTTNGGSDWTNSSLSASRFQDIKFINENTGWMIGSFGKVYKTTNNGGLTSVSPDETQVKNYSLLQNYPNPFNPVTNLEFVIPDQEFVSLIVYDILGNEISVLVNEMKRAGSYTTEWNASEYPSGIYFYILSVKGKFVETKSMMLLK